MLFFRFFVFHKKKKKRNGSSINPGIACWVYISCLWCCLPSFNKVIFFKKFLHEYYQSVKQFWSRSGPTFCRSWSGSKLFAKVNISRRKNSRLAREELIVNEINSAVLRSRNKIHSYHGPTLSSWKSSIHPFHNPLCILPKANTSKLSSIHFKQRITATRTSLIDRQLPNNKYLYRISEARTL